MHGHDCVRMSIRDMGLVVEWLLLEHEPLERAILRTDEIGCLHEGSERVPGIFQVLYD